MRSCLGENLSRLRKVKAKYDPKKVWSKGLVIEPLFEYAIEGTPVVFLL